MLHLRHGRGVAVIDDQELADAIGERLEARKAEAVRRAAERKAAREQLAERRAAGLRRRHAAKLERETSPKLGEVSRGANWRPTSTVRNRTVDPTTQGEDHDDDDG